MTWYPAYCTKQEIVDWANTQNPNLTTGDLPDVFTKYADVEVFRHLKEEGITVDYTGTVSGSTPVPSDINYLLWAASVAFNLEFLAYRGDIYYAPGAIQRTKFGDTMYEFMKLQPMFFMQKGGQTLDDVMPFRSYKQMGQQYIKAYIKAYWAKASGSFVVKPVVGWDSSSRGYAWNADVSGYIRYADSEFDDYA